MNTVHPDYHFCNEHPPHTTDPYKHKHQWEYIGIHPTSGDALFKCRYDPTVLAVTPIKDPRP